MQPVQKLADPHSVASNGANAIDDARIINHDEEHGADLAPTDDLYGVLRTIGVDVADLVPSIYSSARPELDRSPVSRDHACMISSFVRARPLARPQTQTLSC